MNRAIVLCALPALLLGCGVRGSGVAKTETRDVKPFTEVEIDGIGELILAAGPAPSLVVSGDDNLLPLLETEVKGERLVVKGKKSMSTKLKLEIKATTPAVKLVSASGVSVVSLSGVASDELRIDVSGAATVTAKGRARKLTAVLSGVGKLEATRLSAEAATVDVSGSASADVNASESLEAKVSGTGRVRYAGEPKRLSKDVSSVGSVDKM